MIREALDLYSKQSPEYQLENWEKLIQFADDYCRGGKRDKLFAKKLLHHIDYTRSLMGSSKKYESTTEYDVKLVKAALEVAKISVEGKDLAPHIESALYYAGMYPTIFNHQELVNILNKLRSD